MPHHNVPTAETHLKTSSKETFHTNPWKAQTNDDGYSTADEEEVIFELDEVALSKLPLHLQKNMRAIHAERVHRLQQEQHRYLHQPVKSQNPKPFESRYADKWFENMIVKISAARELEFARAPEGGVGDARVSRPEDMMWCPVRHGLVPVPFGQGYNRNIDMAGDNRAALLGDLRGYEKTRWSPVDSNVARWHRVTTHYDQRESSYGGQMSDWKYAGREYYVYEARSHQDSRQQGIEVSSEPRKSKLSLASISTVRSHIRRKIERVSRIFKK